MTIKNCTQWADNEVQNYRLTNQKLYNAHSKAYKDTHKQVINLSYKSEYNPTAQAIDDTLPMDSLSGYFETIGPQNRNFVEPTDNK